MALEIVGVSAVALEKRAKKMLPAQAGLIV